jgi:putative aldouronate transport system permease protein
VQKTGLAARFKQQKYLLIMVVPSIIFVAIFSYIPVWGMLSAFVDYNPGLGIRRSPFVGLRYFKEFLGHSDFHLLMRNTLAISSLNIVLGIVMPVLFAILLNEFIFSGLKRFIQTVSYLPHFISYVVVANIAITMLSPSGVLNTWLLNMNLIKAPLMFLTNPRGFWFLVAGLNIWKEMGWAAIIYIAAITNIDPQLYEAATVDGAGRVGKIRHITLPGIIPTVVVLTILAVPDLLHAGFDPSYLLGNPIVSDYSRVLDTHIYAVGIQQGRFALATAVGIMRMGIGLILILLANTASRMVSEYSLF